MSPRLRSTQQELCRGNKSNLTPSSAVKTFVSCSRLQSQLILSNQIAIKKEKNVITNRRKGTEVKNVFRMS